MWRPAGRCGYTLMEVMIVIIVIAILATIVGIVVFNAGNRARESAQKEHLRWLNWATLAYQADTGEFPATLDECVAPEGSGPFGYQGPYFPPPVPKDPITQQDYAYDPSTGRATAP